MAGATGLTTLALPLLLVAALLGSFSPLDTTLPTPTTYDGNNGGCTAPDPTGGRCLTPATANAYEQVTAAFGRPGSDRPIRSAGCWDAHTWNPTSDHPKGRACDFFPGPPSVFAHGADLDTGWRLATWLRLHADALHVAYVIWQGRIWTDGEPDLDGWGRAYAGGGIYDPQDPTGGHYDHVHMSIQPK